MYFYISSLSDDWFANIVYHYIGHLITLLIVFFAVQNCFNLCNPISLLTCVISWSHIQKIIAQIKALLTRLDPKY